MVATIKTSITIPETLCNQAEILAQHLNISRNHLFRIAIEDFISAADQEAKPVSQSDEARLVINQGDIFWVQLEAINESEPGIPHPHVVIQDNVFNHSRINTVVACALTSNIKRANMPGNVLLDVGEANLLKQSVVEVSKVSAVDKAQLGEYIGTLTEQRISQILAGMRFLQASFFAR
jgi:mRNA interferase MazF